MKRSLLAIILILLFLFGCTRQTDNGDSTVNSSTLQSSSSSENTTVAASSASDASSSSSEMSVQTTSNVNASVQGGDSAEPKVRENPLFTALDDVGSSEECIALIVVKPDDDILSLSDMLDTYSFDMSGESMLVVPRYIGSSVRLQTMSSDKNGNVYADSVIYSKNSSAENYGLYLFAQRRQPAQLMLTIEYGVYKDSFLLQTDENTDKIFKLNARIDLDDIDPTVKFHYMELSGLFQNKYDNLQSFFGMPDKTNSTLFYGMQAYEYVFGVNIFRIEPVSGAIYEVEIHDNSVTAVRGLGIDSTAALVRASFPDYSDGTRFKTESEIGIEYEMLYGQYDDVFGTGRAIYEGDKLLKIEYVSVGTTLVFEFTDEVVSGILCKT